MKSAFGLLFAGLMLGVGLLVPTPSQASGYSECVYHNAFYLHCTYYRFNPSTGLWEVDYTYYQEIGTFADPIQP
jgi:hypothetical protein